MTSAPTSGPTTGPAARPTEWRLLVEPTDGLQPIDELLSSARTSIELTMYELADPSIVAILEQDVARGVQVRVLLDQDGSGRAVNAAAEAELAGHGVPVRFASPAAIYHEKAFVVDGSTAAIMTLNFTSGYYSDTRDFAIVTTEPGDVGAIRAVFDHDWDDTSAPPGPGVAAPGLVWSPGSEPVLVGLINSAQRSLLVENEEMDDPAVESALEAAAGRGVDVEVVMTAAPEWAAAFTRLIAHGVHVRTGSSERDLYIHAKVIVADGATAFVGSQNFSRSSLDRNRELGVVSSVPAVVAGVSQVVRTDAGAATPFGSGG